VSTGELSTAASPGTSQERYRHISLTRPVEGVALMTFKRPEVRNALSGQEMILEIAAAVAFCDSSHTAALVITGEGKSFSAGGDVKHMVSRTGLFQDADTLEIIERYRHGIQHLQTTLQHVDLVTVAAVNGAAVGAGMDLALACDLVYCSARAVFSAPFITLGLVAGDGGIPLLIRSLGRQRSAELLFAGKRLTAAEARDAGLVAEVLSDGKLLDRALEVAGAIGMRPRQATRLTKRLLRLASAETGPVLSELSAAYQAILQNGLEHQEAVRALGSASRPAADREPSSTMRAAADRGAVL
jgi:enoyl-CoA hydratase/carnithine racemase